MIIHEGRPTQYEVGDAFHVHILNLGEVMDRTTDIVKSVIIDEHQVVDGFHGMRVFEGLRAYRRCETGDLVCRVKRTYVDRDNVYSFDVTIAEEGGETQ